MRVWALASCGGLLALTACSANQTTTTNPNSSSPDGDRLSQGKPLPPTAAPSPLARPEMPPRQTLAARPRLNPAAVSARADRPAAQPQSDQLRARLQRLRAQQGARLVSGASIAAAPIPAPALAEVVASPIPQPGAPTLIQGTATPGPSRGDGLTIARQPHRAEQSPLEVVTPPLPSPQPPVAKANGESSGTAADLQPVITASIASNYPIAPLRHQGHSARHSARSALPQVLVPPPTSQPISASARLHGSTAPALATQPRGGSTTPISEPEATVVLDSTQDAADLLARAPEAAISRHHVASPSRVGSSVTLVRPGDFPRASLAEEAHQQESTAPLRAERLPLQASLAPRPDAPATGDQSLGAIALPESLPLNRAAPRLSPHRPQLSVSAPAAVTDRATPEPAIPAANTVDLPPAVPSTAPSGEHVSPMNRDSFHLVPSASQSPKGLPLAHCPPARAHTPTADRIVDGAIAAQPSFSGRNQSMPLAKDAPLAPCWHNALTQSATLEAVPAPAPDPGDRDVSPVSGASLDLENLTPDPATY